MSDDTLKADDLLMGVPTAISENPWVKDAIILLRELSTANERAEKAEQHCIRLLMRADKAEQELATMRDHYSCEICSRDMNDTTSEDPWQVPICLVCWNDLAREKLEAEQDNIPISKIESEIDDIKDNGLSLVKYGGSSAEEGRCRELCSMYLSEFILSHKLALKLDAIDKAMKAADA